MYMVKNVWVFYDPPDHVSRLLENQTKKRPKIQMFGFQVLGVQMVIELHPYLS